MLYGIKIDREYFDLNKCGEVERMFIYCEQKYNLGGKQWEEIKNDFLFEELGELIEMKGGNYEEFIE